MQVSNMRGNPNSIIRK